MTSDSTDTTADNSDDEWKFSEGDTIREVHEQFAPGGVSIGKSEYRIRRQLRDVNTGERFYDVDTVEGGTHLYAASAIEHSYEVVDEEFNEA